MFGIVADLIASVTTILLPAYLSYKALRSHDPAQSHPWLIYFTILSLTLLFESWTLFIIGWIPFYSWFRLFFLLYLVLPQTQGAKILYLNYLEPYIVDHETRIDHFISDSHQWLQQMGMGYFNVVVEWLRDKILGQSNPQQAAAPQGYNTYAQDLLSRFAMPAARGDAAGIYNMVSGFAGMAGKRDITAEAASIPDSIVRDISLRDISAPDRSKALARETERLTAILKALEAEKQSNDLAYGSVGKLSASSGGLKAKSRSEQSFENLSYDDAVGADLYSRLNQSDRRSTSGSWMPAGVSGWWGGSGGAASAGPNETDDPSSRSTSKGWGAAKDITDALSEGLSSGVERRR